MEHRGLPAAIGRSGPGPLRVELTTWPSSNSSFARPSASTQTRSSPNPDRPLLGRSRLSDERRCHTGVTPEPEGHRPGPTSAKGAGNEPDPLAPPTPLPAKAETEEEALPAQDIVRPRSHSKFRDFPGAPASHERIAEELRRLGVRPGPCEPVRYRSLERRGVLVTTRDVASRDARSNLRVGRLAEATARAPVEKAVDAWRQYRDVVQLIKRADALFRGLLSNEIDGLRAKPGQLVATATKRLGRDQRPRARASRADRRLAHRPHGR